MKHFSVAGDAPGAGYWLSSTRLSLASMYFEIFELKLLILNMSRRPLLFVHVSAPSSLFRSEHPTRRLCVQPFLLHFHFRASHYPTRVTSVPHPCTPPASKLDVCKGNLVTYLDKHFNVHR